MRINFDEQLVQLNNEMIEMGSLCETIIDEVTKVIISGDLSKLEDIQNIAAKIDKKERNIESSCLKLLLRQQPVASDLRKVSSALKMITDMERIGDQAEDILSIFRKSNIVEVREVENISELSKATIEMVRNSVESYVKQDVDLANKVIEDDDKVDKYFRKVRKELIRILSENELEGEEILDLLMITKYYEKIGDHAANIAEWVIFSVTGKHNTI
ncbi:MAG: phosphate signaling complex protein PhoU [Gemella sp.]|nr:phosphate signaling complex protein PhoU [Gemella sp.]